RRPPFQEPLDPQGPVLSLPFRLRAERRSRSEDDRLPPPGPIHDPHVPGADPGSNALQQRQLSEMPRGGAEVPGGDVTPHGPQPVGRERDELPELSWPGASDPGGADARLAGLRPAHEGRVMRELRWETWAAILAFLITLGYVWNPGPY